MKTRQAQRGSRLRARPGSEIDNVGSHFPSFLLEMGQAKERGKLPQRRASVDASNWAHTCRWAI